MSRPMPTGGWSIEEVARVIGADPRRMRRHAIKFSSLYGLRSGRYIENETGLEHLLKDAGDYGCDPSAAFDRWHQHGSGSDVVFIVDDIPWQPRPFKQAPRHVGHGAGAPHGQGPDVPIAALAECVADLMAIVATQQRQIQELYGAATLSRVQATVSDQAGEHFHKAISSSAQILADLGRPSGEVRVDSVIQKGSLSVRRSASSEAGDSRSVAAEQSKPTGVDVGRELKGLATKIAGGKLGVKVDLSKAEKRVEELVQHAKSASSEAIEGTFEIQYHGVAIKVGP